jgi:hypothetical protein
MLVDYVSQGFNKRFRLTRTGASFNQEAFAFINACIHTSLGLVGGSLCWA